MTMPPLRFVSTVVASLTIPTSTARVPGFMPLGLSSDQLSNFFFKAEQEHVNAKLVADAPHQLIGAAVVLLIVGIAVFCFIKSRRGAEEEGASAEGNEAKESVAEGSVAGKVAKPLKTESAAAEPASLDDYETLFRKLAHKGAQQVGPKLAKGAEVRSIVEDKMHSIKTKGKALLVSELNDAAGSISRALEAEESMLLLDWDAAVAANFPPATILVAGLLVPATLSLSILSHTAQILIVLLPTMLLCASAEYMDYYNPCHAIPGLRLWSQLTGVLTFAICISRLVMLSRTRTAEKDLMAKSEEMKVRLAKAEAGSAQAGGRGLADLRELFVCHSTMLQYAVVCEERTRGTVFNHVVGFGTFLWLLTVGWAVFLTSRYTFVPGVVAFHPAAAGDPDFCKAWMTVIAARISVLLGVLFFFVNVLTVIGWVLETTLHTPSISHTIQDKAKHIDGGMMGLPVVQFIVKSFLFRGSADVLSARLAVAFSEKSELAKEFADAETRLALLKGKVEAKDSQMQQLSKDVNECGGTLEDQAKHFQSVGLDTESLRKQGNDVIEARKRQAMLVEEATTDEIDKLVEKIRNMASSIEQSEQFQAAKKNTADSYDKAAAAAQGAARNVQESDQFKSAQKGLEQAKEVAQLGQSWSSSSGVL